ncbi:hypothetical protein TKK_0015290 [Trichogramma kaykai]
MSQYKNITIIKTCLNCENDDSNPIESSEITTVFPDIHVVWDKNFKHFAKSLDEKFKISYLCKKCKNQRDTKYIMGSYLLIEVDTAYQDSSYAKSIFKDTSAVYTKVEDIPENITVNDINFILAGVIRFTPPPSVGGLGHYTAYCRKNNGNWDYRDDQHQRKKEKCSIKTDIKISSILHVRNTNN